MPATACKTALAAVFSLLAAGCASLHDLDKRSSCIESNGVQFLGGLFSTRSDKFNVDCAKEQAARRMLETNDPGMQAVGASVLGERHENLDEATRATIQRIKPQDLECTVTEVEETGAGKQAKMVCKPRAPSVP